MPVERPLPVVHGYPAVVPMIANIFYALGSLCFLAGTVWNMVVR